MSVASVLAPVFVQVALTYVLLLAMVAVRGAASRNRPFGTEDLALGRVVWPRQAAQINNSFANQFEMPVLFFALVPLALVTHRADVTFVVLEWLFVASRLVHAAVHTTSNNMALRGPAFMVSVVVLGIAWIEFGFGILTAGSP